MERNCHTSNLAVFLLYKEIQDQVLCKQKQPYDLKLYQKRLQHRYFPKVVEKKGIYFEEHMQAAASV